MNVALKRALVGRAKQYELAGRLGLSETAFSRIINGRQKPDEELQQRIAEELEMPVADLFPAESATTGGAL